MFWSNLFKKKNKIFNTYIVNNSSTKISSFEELTTKEQEYVNNLKEEYLKFYENEDNYINLDNELFNEIKMYQDLALDIMHKDHFGNIVNSIIDSKKLAYYSQKITEINNTLKYKYIALNKLRKDKKYLTKHMGLYVLGRRKINILKALDHQMNIINNMFVIADQKITDYCACAIANYPKNINENTKHELENRYNKVEKDYKKLFNSSINLDDNLTTIDKTTYIEIIIDKFIYENKDLIDKLKEQLDLIANSEIKDKTMQQEIIDNLMKIKMYYNIFNKYSRNKLTQDDFNDLYQIIFNVYTYFPFNNGFKNYCEIEANKEELKLYNHFLQSKLEMFLLKKSKIFETNIINDKIYDHLLEIFNSNQAYDLQKTDLPKDNLISDSFDITKFEDLDLLLALDYPNGFDLYFNEPLMFEWNDLNLYIDKYTIRKEFYKYILGSHTYKKDNISCDSKKLNKINNDCKLFSLLYKDKINFNILPFLSESCSIDKLDWYIYYSCNISKDCHIQYHQLYLPDKIKKLYIDYSEIYVSGVKQIYLNNGLNELAFKLPPYDSKFRVEEMQIILPKDLKPLNIKISMSNIYNDYYFYQLYYVILEICKTIALPSSIIRFFNNNEHNNKMIFNYLYHLLYEFFMVIKKVTIGNKYDYYTIFSEMLNKLAISYGKNNHISCVGEHILLNNPDLNSQNKLKYVNDNDIEKAYKLAIKDYIEKINSYYKDYFNFKCYSDEEFIKLK